MNICNSKVKKIIQKLGKGSKNAYLRKKEPHLCNCTDHWVSVASCCGLLASDCTKFFAISGLLASQESATGFTEG